MPLYKKEIKKECDRHNEISSWAELNFYLQSTLYKKENFIFYTLDEKLDEVGYTGKDIRELKAYEYKKLFEKESFFSYSSTGKRIVAFALKLNGLNKEKFKDIENSITYAYRLIKKEYPQSVLLEKSYEHCLYILAVF